MTWLPLPLAADTSERLGGTLGVLAWRLGIRRRDCNALITRCLGVRGAERARIVRQAYASMGANFLALWTVGGPSGPETGIRFLNPRWFRQVLAEGRGAVFLTGHIGSWDMAAHAASRLVPMSVYAKAQHSERGDALINAQRERLGLKIIITRPGDRTTAVTALRALRAGHGLGIMADQRPGRGEGHPLRFFGIPTWGHAGPAFFAAKARCPIIPGIALRVGAGRYVVWAGRPWRPAADDAVSAQRVADQLATLIARFPGQYFWHHRRFAGPPPEVAQRDDEPWKRGLRELA